MRQDEFQSPEYRRSRGAYVAQCALEYWITLLATDAFLAKLLTSLGFSDSLTGIVSSLTSVALLFQLGTIFLVRTRVSAKKAVIFFDTISQLLFMLLYLVPFFPIGDTARKMAVMIAILMAYGGQYLILNLCFQWANSYVEPSQRGSYSANKEIVSLISGIVFTAVAGYVMDYFEASGNIRGGFLVMALVIFAISIGNFCCLMMIKKEDQVAQESARMPLSEVLRKTVGNRNFRNVLIMTILWKMGLCLTIGFLGTFKTKDLLLSVFAVQLINIAANIVRIAISRAFGRYADRTSFAKGFELALIFAAGAFFFNIFTTRSHWFFIVIYTVLYNVSMAGVNQNEFNIAYSYVDQSCITQALSMKNCLGGAVRFGASLLGGKILSAVQANGNRVLGIPMYGQQLLSAISFVLVVITLLFTHFVVTQQKVMKQ